MAPAAPLYSTGEMLNPGGNALKFRDHKPRLARLLGLALLAGAVAATGAQSSGMKGTPPTTQPAIQNLPEMLNLDALVEQGKLLLEEARTGDGSANLTLTHYRDHYTLLAAHAKSGVAEQHNRYADFVIVLDGEGTELTGGTMVDRTDAPNGEIRGSKLEGATPHLLHKGDIFHIPAGTPHQMIVAAGQSITEFVIKIEETPPRAAEEQP